MKTAGLDLGTNSIGITVRDTELSEVIQEQFEYFTSVIFKSGVGTNKSGEFSFAAERTKKRSPRRLYQARKYRIWSTLKVLIKTGYCPLSQEDLDKWSKYDKANGLKRQYPIHATAFEQWIRLDFDGDGKSDYTSPYQLRAELMEKQFDFTNETDCFKLGRALYHIAQRRGFKSSKGETMKEQEKSEVTTDIEVDLIAALKKSEQKKAKTLTAYMEEHNLTTVGCALAHLENSGIRVRNSEYQAVRSQYKEEIKAIFEYQEGLSIDSELYTQIVSEKKYEGTIFYKRPLRSQKGLIGKCTLETNKSRSPISHPEFEKFRAWSFINNIRYGSELKETLTREQKERLFRERFLLTRANFKFEDIRKWMEKELYLHLNHKTKTINYKDNTNVSGCPISGRLKELLGENWEAYSFSTIQENRKGDLEEYTYQLEDLWHICFSFDEDEYVKEFAKSKLGFDDTKANSLVAIWEAIPQGYANLSLKAIKNINRFLTQGLIYTEAVLLAKLPDILKERWDENAQQITESINELIAQNRYDKLILNIANSLIANYKSLDESEQFAFRNNEYELDQDDYNDIQKVAVAAIGMKSWEKKEYEEQKQILSAVANCYQQFFISTKRDYFTLPKLADALSTYLSKHYSFLSEKELRKIYHPSMIEFYAPAKEQRIDDGRFLKLLGSPVIGALKNPMAMRVLHTLRKQCNELLRNGTIDENTRMVVETARDLNDANMRWAIEAYQREREKENKVFLAVIQEYFPNNNVTDDQIDKARLLCEQNDIPERGELNIIFDKENANRKKTKKVVEKADTYKKDVTKYRLWLEQGCRCIYTGELINIVSLFDGNATDFEHTIPRSISFDDSLENLTVCLSTFNRITKQNRIPAQLSNHEEILLRIQPWIEKVERLKDYVEFWKGQSKRAQEKDRKDYCIRQRHLWQMELDYWHKKVERFTMTEVTSGFRNSQLVDTRIITKYAYHYLKTVFQHVEVQKGSVTANFRKMLGVQSIEEKKSRDKHSHHAIDAAMLTLIPSAARRDKMLELYFQKEEEKKQHGNQTDQFNDLEAQLMQERRKCEIGGNISDIVPFIEENILVNHIAKDQTLTPAHRKARRRGKEIFITGKDGQITNKWITGDCIRGQLHGETYYGAITQDKNNEQVYYVVRRDLKHKKNDQDSGFKTWNELENVIVNKMLIPMMKSQFEDGISFKDAIEKGIWMLNRDGKKVNRIRHIRCYTTIKNPLKIKKQTYLSASEHKQYYYAEMGDLYAMCKYENDIHKEYIIYSLFDISENRKYLKSDIPKTISSKKGNLYLSEKMVTGDMILIYRERVEELLDLDKSQLSQRLYVIRGFENDGKRIILRKSINSQQEKELGKGESVKNFEEMPEKVRCGINTLKYRIINQTCRFKTNGVLELI
ncbi:MAG: type II CRISPR RNA-guided endonuclease Cas9 [Phocaeicola sp.]